MEHFDVAVIGSGGGLKIAMPAAGMGLKTVLIDPGPIGGTCLNRGCIPSKMLIYPADFLLRMQQADHINIHLPGTPAVNFPALAGRMQADVLAMSNQLEQRIRETENLTWIRDVARFTGRKILAIGESRRITAERFFIATGSSPLIPSISGLGTVPYLTSTEALRLTALPKEMIILGAGYIACELGHAFSAFGTRVHYLVRSRFLRHEDGEVQHLFEELFSRRHAVHHGEPLDITHDQARFSVRLRKEGGQTETVTGDALLVASGVVPNTEGLHLEAAGITRDQRGFINVDDCLQTTADGVYALGDCVGRYLFRHSVNREGEYLERTVLRGGERHPLEYGPMPHGVFTYPEIAAAGATEEVLQGHKEPYVVGRAFYRDSNAGLARRMDDGFVKLLVHRQTGSLLGIHVIGEDACTLIQGVLPLMYHGGTLEHLLRTVYIHPALPELIHDAARDACKKLESGVA